MRDQAADRDSSESIQKWKNRLPNGATDIFEINVNAIGAGRRELRWKIRGAMIHNRVKTQLITDEGAFLRPSSNANRPRALDPRDLADR